MQVKKKTKKTTDAVIAFESSCDETAIAIMSTDGKVLIDECMTQTNIHKEFGGVMPEIASRNHILNIQKLLKKTIQSKQWKDSNIVATCATIGPGLMGGLIVGSMTAKGVAHSINIPFIGINHLEGHILSVKIENQTLEFPFLAILVSGGHSQIVLAEKLGKYKILSQSIDDAVGEAFDKIGRALGFDYPAGKQIDEIAKKGNKNRFKIAIPMQRFNTLDMSFSGLKTSAMHVLQDIGDQINDRSTLQDFCASVQHSITKSIEIRAERIIKSHVEDNKIKSVVLCGGVAANSSIRATVENLSRKYGIDCFVPSAKYCTDNAVMIAMVGVERYKNKMFSGLDAIPKSSWSLEDLEYE